MAESPLGRLIGTWEFEPFVEGRPWSGGVARRSRIADGAFVLERTSADWTDPGWVEHAPATSECVLGWDDSTGEVTQLYADDRGVLRIDGRWESSPDGTAWALDFPVTYRKKDG